MTTGKPIIKLLRELLVDGGPGPSRRREILWLAIETIEADNRIITSQRDIINNLKTQVVQLGALVEKLRRGKT